MTKDEFGNEWPDQEDVSRLLIDCCDNTTGSLVEVTPEQMTRVFSVAREEGSSSFVTINQFLRLLAEDMMERELLFGKDCDRKEFSVQKQG